MINSQGFITNISQKQGLPIIIKGSNNTNTASNDRGIVLQANPSGSGNFIINSPQNALKLQGNVLTQVKFFFGLKKNNK